MSKITNFLFYLGLFTINAFRYNWDAIIIPALTCGAIASFIAGSAWLFFPAFVGSYLAQIYNEYKRFKRNINEQ